MISIARRSTAAARTPSSGSSRLRSFGALNEPTVIFVIFVVALTTHTDLPYVLGATLPRVGGRGGALRAIC